MSDVPSIRLGKTAFSVASLKDESDEKAYWLSRTPAERLEAAELMRQVDYGYDPTTAIQRVLGKAGFEKFWTLSSPKTLAIPSRKLTIEQLSRLLSLNHADFMALPQRNLIP